MKLLLKTGKVGVDSKDSHSRTPLSLAAGNGHKAMVKLLLNTEKVGLSRRTPMVIPSCRGRHCMSTKRSWSFWRRLGPEKVDIVSDGYDSCQTLLSLWMSIILP